MTNAGIAFDLYEQAQELARAIRDLRENLSASQIGPDTDLAHAALKIENAAKHVLHAFEDLR